MFKRSISLFDALFDRIFAVIGALVFSQAPLFFQHYMQRLSGHVDELTFQMNAIQQIAERGGKSLSEYIHKFVAHADSDIAAQGQLLQQMIKRHSELNYALVTMQEASLLSRPFYFIKQMDVEIVQATFKDFSFGLTWSLEGLAYACLGILFGIGVYHIFRSCIRLPKKLFIR